MDSDMHFLAAKLRSKIEVVSKDLIKAKKLKTESELCRSVQNEDISDRTLKYSTDIKLDQLSVQNQALERENRK
jgi:hypothetical protein